MGSDASVPDDVGRVDGDDELNLEVGMPHENCWDHEVYPLAPDVDGPVEDRRSVASQVDAVIHVLIFEANPALVKYSSVSLQDIIAPKRHRTCVQKQANSHVKAVLIQEGRPLQTHSQLHCGSQDCLNVRNLYRTDVAIEDVFVLGSSHFLYSLLL